MPRAAQERGVELAKVYGFQSLTGRGIKGTVATHVAALGNQKLMDATAIEQIWSVVEKGMK
jgi:cation transport ATPase